MFLSVLCSLISPYLCTYVFIVLVSTLRVVTQLILLKLIRGCIRTGN